MEVSIEKEQMLILLNKVKSIVDSISIEEWPSNLHINWDSDGRVSNLEINLNRCKIFISDYKISRYIKVEFKVGTSVIIGIYHIPRFAAIFSKVYRLWREICKKITTSSNLYQEALIKKQADEQREIFNELYYTQFPEEIDDIILGEDDG